MDGAAVFWLIPIVAIIGGIAVAIVNSINRTRLREFQIRERIAMIERGLVPSPEADPRGFDRAMSRYERPRELKGGGGRHRRAGVILMGVGFGIMPLIALAGGQPIRAFGVGSFLVILGLAMLVNGLMDQRQVPARPSPPSTPGPEPLSGERPGDS
jgi:hypothetical protein